MNFRVSPSVVISTLPSPSVPNAETAAASPWYGSLSCKGESVPTKKAATLAALSPQLIEVVAAPKISLFSSKLHLANSDATYFITLAWIDLVEFFFAAAV